MSTETLEAKLRNQLSPLYGLADCILLIDEHPDLKPIVMKMAKEAVDSKKRIDVLLKAIEGSIDIKAICESGHIDRGNGTCIFCEFEMS